MKTVDRIEAEMIAKKRAAIKNLLAKCSEKERKFFDRLFPMGVPKEDLNAAIRLVERTVENKEKCSEKEKKFVNRRKREGG